MAREGYCALLSDEGCQRHPGNERIQLTRKARRHTTPDLENTTKHTIILLQIVLELAAAAGVAQLAECLRLDLADTLAGDVELFANLFERAAAAIVQPKAQPQHLLLALGQTAERVFHLLREQLMAGGVGWAPARL